MSGASVVEDLFLSALQKGTAEERAARDRWLQAKGWRGRELILIQPGNHRSMGPRRGFLVSALTSVKGLMFAAAAWNSGVPEPGTG